MACQIKHFAPKIAIFFHHARPGAAQSRPTLAKGTPMKAGIHPEYKEVIFFDASVDFKFLTRTTMQVRGSEKMTWTDGKEYPVVRLDVSSESHPFYTGKQKIVDTAGRIDKFKNKYSMLSKK
jgi:large subunit ribosomal protein L31